MSRLSDLRFMDAALALARSGAGRTSSNPSVGCVLVHEGRVIGAARTADGGRPHAETLALEHAGSLPQGTTAYVTLEPCAHTGVTGPCADALVAAGLTRCVIALTDPDPRVNGGGITKLRAAGVAVETGLREDTARVVHAEFLRRFAPASG